MYLLRTCGPLSLLRDGAPVDSIHTHRNALAVLVVLATDGPATRDRLMALLWPDSAAARARGSLKQVLHFLRRHLEPLPLVAGPLQLALDERVVTSDLRLIRDAMAAGDPASVVALYHAPFLDGVHLGGSVQLEHWISRRRAELADAYRSALELLASRAGERGLWPEAVGWWRRLQAEDPLDGHAALELMRALAAAGQSVAAIRHGRSHELLVREELGLAPDLAVSTLVERLRRQAASGSGAASIA